MTTKGFKKNYDWLGEDCVSSTCEGVYCSPVGPTSKEEEERNRVILVCNHCDSRIPRYNPVDRGNKAPEVKPHELIRGGSYTVAAVAVCPFCFGVGKDCLIVTDDEAPGNDSDKRPVCMGCKRPWPMGREDNDE